jgi:hypothetical protein
MTRSTGATHRGPTSSLRSIAALMMLAPFAGCRADPDISAVGPGGRVTTAPSGPRGRDAGGFTFVTPEAGAAPPINPAGGCGFGTDVDHDGYTVEQGDCNDCDRLVNPGAYDVPGNGVDEDCSGTADDEPANCDTGLPVDGDGVAAARALGICRVARADAQGKERTWGLIRAGYVFPDGSTAALQPGANQCGRLGDPPNALSHGVLPQFGTALKPRQGGALVALSTGIARPGRILLPSNKRASPDGASMCTRSVPPMGFPVSAYSTCGDLQSVPGQVDARDPIALELVLRVPTNAASLSFDFDFYTFEYHEFICSFFNDAFVALLYSRTPDLPANHNIAFDSQGNPVSVNNGFVEVCAPFTYAGSKGMTPFTRPFPCKLGVAELAGTGFENRAATGWLQTHSNVVPGEEITLRFAIWDSGDEILDSTVLLDNFKWDARPGSTITVRPPPIE